MKHLDLKVLSNEKINEYIEAFEIHKNLMYLLGGCPDIDDRVNPNCFYCDDCWISTLKKVAELKENI